MAALLGIAAACASGGSEGGDALEEGRAVYASTCSACHLPDGSGGELAESLATVTETFPDCADHIRWITLGSDRWKTEVGDTYGATAKEITRIMPSFEETLSAQQIAQVAAFERSRYGGMEAQAALEDCAAS